MNPRLFFSVSVSLHLKRLTAALDVAEAAAKTAIGAATLTGMESPVTVTEHVFESEAMMRRQLETEVTAALRRAEEAERRWSPEELAKFRTLTDNVKEAGAAAVQAARRLKRVAVAAVFGLALLSVPDYRSKAEEAPVPAPAPEVGKPVGMPEVQIDMAWGWMEDLPKNNETRVSQWPDGELMLSRLPEGSRSLDALEEVRRQTAEALKDTVASIPSGLAELMVREQQKSSGTPELNFKVFIFRLGEMQKQGDPRADQLMEIVSVFTERLDEIHESHEEALDPLMAACGPATALTDAGLKPDLGFESPEGKRALDDFTKAMRAIGVKVEYKSARR